MASFLVPRESPNHFGGLQRGLGMNPGLSNGTFQLFDQQSATAYQLSGMRRVQSASNKIGSTSTVDPENLSKQGLSFHGGHIGNPTFLFNNNAGDNTPPDVKPLPDGMLNSTYLQETTNSSAKPASAPGTPTSDDLNCTVDMTQDAKVDLVPKAGAFMGDNFFTSFGALSFVQQSAIGPGSYDSHHSVDSASTKSPTPAPRDLPANKVQSQATSPGSTPNTNPNTPREAGSTTSHSSDDSQAMHNNWDAAVIRLSLDSSGRAQETKLASEELLEMCRRQGLVPKYDVQAGDPSLQQYVPSTVGMVELNQATADAGQANDGAAGAAQVLHVDDPSQSPMPVPAQGTPQYQQFAEKMMYRNSDSKMVMMPAETFVSMRQQLEAAKADKARLVASLKSAQNACARKDEQIMDLQRRHGLLVQQYNNLQSMYQSVLNQLQQEQQQYTNSSMQLQGELQGKQQIEQLLQMLNKQLQSELQQKKAISVKLASEAASRQQLQEQLNAANAQLQQQNGNVETIQWLQGVKKRLEDELRGCTAQMQQEMKRRNDVSMQLQNVMAEKQRMQAEFSSIRSQASPQMQSMMRAQDNGLDSAVQMQPGFQMQGDEVVPKYASMGMPHMPVQDLSTRSAADNITMMHMPPRQGMVGYGPHSMQVPSTMPQVPMMGYGAMPMTMRGGGY